MSGCRSPASLSYVFGCADQKPAFRTRVTHLITSGVITPTYGTDDVCSIACAETVRSRHIRLPSRLVDGRRSQAPALTRWHAREQQAFHVAAAVARLLDRVIPVEALDGKIGLERQ